MINIANLNKIPTMGFDPDLGRIHISDPGPVARKETYLCPDCSISTCIH